MARKNKRKRNEYRQHLGFNPRKYVRYGGLGYSAFSGYSMDNSRDSAVVGTKVESSHRTNISRIPHRGDIWFAELGEHPGTSVQSGCRPVLVISNDKGNQYAETVNVLPMTSHLKKLELPCHTELQPEIMSDARQQLEQSMILAEQITTISKTQLRNYVGKISDTDFLSRIDRTLFMQLGITSANT